MLVTVDTGGTKTLVASFSEDGVLGEQIQFATPKTTTGYANQLRKTLVEAYKDQPVEAVVIALPGIIKDGIAIWCENLEWRNFDAGAALAGVLGDTPILIENDANLAGLSEARSLDPIPTSLLYVTVSTGIGTGIITHGHINPGLRYSEGGRSLVEYDGKVREWEDFASGKAIHTVYKKYARDITSRRSWSHIADRISRGFLAIIPFLQPETIVIGGSIGTYFERYEQPLLEILHKKLPPHIPTPTIIKAAHPELAVIYGCYYYALDNLSPDTNSK